MEWGGWFGMYVGLAVIGWIVTSNIIGAIHEEGAKLREAIESHERTTAKAMTKHADQLEMAVKLLRRDTATLE